MIQARFYRPEDYALLAGWWEGHAQPVIPQYILPPVGLMVEFDGAPLCALFIYQTDSPIALWENVIADPKSSRLVRRAAMDVLARAAEEATRRCGKTEVMVLSNHPRVVSWLGEHQFRVTSQGMACMFKRLEV